MKKTEKKHAFDQEKSKIKKKENKRSIKKKKRKKTRLRPGKKVRHQDLVHIKKKRKFWYLYFFSFYKFLPQNFEKTKNIRCYHKDYPKARELYWYRPS